MTDTNSEFEMMPRFSPAHSQSKVLEIWVVTRISVDHGSRFGRHEFPSPEFEKIYRICWDLMQNLLDSYEEESQSSHISIVNDDTRVIVDSDPEKEPISVEKSSTASKSEPKR